MSPDLRAKLKTMADREKQNRYPLELRSFGRRRGRAPSPRQKRLMQELLPKVALNLSRPAPVPLMELFSPLSVTETWLEIGFGGAEHLIWQARHHPNIGLIGCEPFEDGVTKALSAVEEQNLANVRLHADDARDVLRWLPQASVTRAFILFPDPWPKRRHSKRRLINGSLLGALARIIRPGGEFRIATDIGDYVRTIHIAFQSQSDFAWQCSTPEDWRRRPSDWPGTRYEAKALREGRRCYYMTFKRR